MEPRVSCTTEKDPDASSTEPHVQKPCDPVWSLDHMTFRNKLADADEDLTSRKGAVWCKMVGGRTLGWSPSPF